MYQKFVLTKVFIIWGRNYSEMPLVFLDNNELNCVNILINIATVVLSYIQIVSDIIGKYTEDAIILFVREPQSQSSCSVFSSFKISL